MPRIVIPETLDQAGADKLLRDLATRVNKDGDTIDMLRRPTSASKSA